MRRQLVTSAVWAATFLCLIVGGLIAAILVVMPTSLGPSELIEGGLEPWMMALYAACGFVALVVAAIAGLLAWHSVRFRAFGLVLVALEVAAVVWASVDLYFEYF